MYIYGVKGKYTLLQLFPARTYKIYKERVDNDDETADNGLPASQSVVSLHLFVNPIFRKTYRKYQKTDTFTGAARL